MYARSRGGSTGLDRENSLVTPVAAASTLSAVSGATPAFGLSHGPPDHRPARLVAPPGHANLPSPACPYLARTSPAPDVGGCIPRHPATPGRTLPPCGCSVGRRSWRRAGWRWWSSHGAWRAGAIRRPPGRPSPPRGGRRFPGRRNATPEAHPPPGIVRHRGVRSLVPGRPPRPGAPGHPSPVTGSPTGDHRRAEVHVDTWMENSA